MDLSAFIPVAQELRALGLKVSQHGQLIAQWHGEEEIRRNIYSATKSFTACAVGFALQEGLLTLEEKLTDAFPDDLPAVVDDHLHKATVRDLLTMCLGQAEPGLMAAQRPLYQEDDWVKLCLALPFSHDPGTHFLYSNVGPYLAGILVQRRAGCDLVEYLLPRLFTPLGIKRPTWEIDPLGRQFGAGGLFLTLTELHRFGQFCLNKGSWDGQQLLDAKWIEACAAPSDVDFYGYLFWRGEHHSFRADGKDSQLSIVLPEKDAVISVVAECRQGEAMLRAIYDLLCPQL